jgi:hypothetical protein
VRVFVHGHGGLRYTTKVGLIVGMGLPRWSAALPLCAAVTLAGCGTDATEGDPTPAPPPTVTAALVDCGPAPATVRRQPRDQDIHVVRGTTNIDCAEAVRVIERWQVAGSGRSAGYFKEFEDWDCTAAGDWQDRVADEHMVTCERSDGAMVHLDRP